MSAAGRSALVTGGAGFIGSHLCERLVGEGWCVRVLDDFSTGRASNLDGIAGRIELLRGDVRDEAAAKAAVQGTEVIFHLAAVTSVPGSVAEPLRAHTVNVDGTLLLLEQARRAGVRRLVYAASCSAYGDSPMLPKVEDMTPAPLSPYALQKYVGESYCRLYAEVYGLETVSLRYFNVYGPRQDPASEYATVVPRFVAACLAGRPARVHGDGHQTRDFISVFDAVRANLLAADAPSPAGEVCNVASGRRTSLLDLLAEIQRQTDCDVAPVHEAPRPRDVRDSLASLERARGLLGYEPAVDLEQGLRLTIAHFEKERGREHTRRET